MASDIATTHRGHQTPQSVRCPSQSQRILAARERGGWMTATAIHRSAGTCRLNSRISELRTRGHLIECRHIPGAGSGPDAYEYRLTVPSGEGEQTTPTRLTATSPAPTPSPKNASMVCSLSPDGPATDWGVNDSQPSESFEQLRLVA